MEPRLVPKRGDRCNQRLIKTGVYTEMTTLSPNVFIASIDPTGEERWQPRGGDKRYAADTAYFQIKK